MRISYAVRFFTYTAAILTVSSLASAQVPQVVVGEYLVKFRTARIGAQDVSQKIMGKGTLKGAFKTMGIYHIALKPTDEQLGLDQLRQDPDVEFIEPNYILQTPKVGDDSKDKIVSGFSRSEVEQMDVSGSSVSGAGTYSQSAAPTHVVDSWSVATVPNGSNQIIVAIVDTGLDKTHKVFTAYNEVSGVNNGGTGALWINSIEANGRAGVDDDGNGYVDDINGFNFISNNGSFVDDDGHGTHVAGIVVGAGLNILANPLPVSKIKIMPLKFLDGNGSGSTANAIRAIYYAVDNGARVINNSWGGPSYSRSLHEALAYAYNNEVVIVTAAGNYSKDNDSVSMFPANYDVPSNISVAATTDTDALAYFSNFGKNSVHLGSPGMNIYSTIPGNYYGYLSGTSMAAPFVAGMAAMALSESPNMTGYQLKSMILAQSDGDSNLSTRTTSSARINSLNIVQAAKSMIYTTAYQPDYSPNYQSQDFASSADSGGGSGGCGLVSTAMLKGPGMADPLGVLAGLMLLPLIVWMVLRQMSASPKNQRRHDRFKMNSEVRVKIGDRELVGAMNSISMGGLSFNVDEDLEKGGVVTMRIASPDGNEAIEVQGQIVWSEQNQSYGVQFAGAHDGAKAMIKHWSQSLMKT
jgi:subtilisin family serine protease